MENLTLTLIFAVTVVGQFNFAQENKDEELIAQIKSGAFQNSQITETLGYLTDVFGPRLTASPNLRAAQTWSRNKMSSWGLQNANIETWGNFGPGWSVERFSVEMSEPTYDRLNA